MPLGATGTTTFAAPSGMTIADFTLTRQLTYRNGAPASNTRRLYAIYKLGSTVFAGAGHYDNATRNRLQTQGSWYGHPEANVVVPKSTVSRASFPALAGYTGTATTLQIAVGCFNGTVNDAVLRRRRRRHLAPDLRRPHRAQRPDAPERGRRGERPAGRRPPRRLGRRHVRRRPTTAASGASRSSTSAAAAWSASRTTAPARAPTPARPARSACKKACPNLRNETVRPTSLAAGRRTLRLRVIDAGGNVTEQGPYVVDVATPSDRGPLNGSGATDGGKLTAHFSGGSKTHKTVGYRKRATVTGRLLNSAGRPVSGALLNVFTRDRRSGAAFVQRWTAKTDAEGLYRVKVRAAASRLVQVAWASHVRDPSPQESAYVTLNARASSSLKASPRVIGVGRSLRLSGTVRGAVPSRGVPLIFQGRSGARALHDVRRRPRQRQGPVQDPLPLPLRRLARPQLHLPGEAARRCALPVRAGLLQARASPGALRPR